MNDTYDAQCLPAGGTDEPGAVLSEAFWSRAKPFVQEMRDLGWPLMTTLVGTQDGRLVAVISVELMLSIRAENGQLASPLPLVAGKTVVREP